MRVVLYCRMVEETAPGRFLAVLEAAPAGGVVEVETDCPLVPGSTYYLMIKGLMADGDGHQGRFVNDLLSFAAAGKLTSLDVVAENEYLHSREKATH